MYEGIKLDGAAAADHTAVLYCVINETLERLCARKMYKSGAAALRASVDNALLMCSQLEAGTGYASFLVGHQCDQETVCVYVSGGCFTRPGYSCAVSWACMRWFPATRGGCCSSEGTMVLESVLNNPLPLAKFSWSRRHEALRLARLALHSMHRLFTAGLGDFNLEVTFSPSCAFSNAPATTAAPPSTAAASGAAASVHAAGGAQEASPACPAQARPPAAPHTLTVASPGRAAVPAAAVAAAGAALAMQAKLDIGIQTDSGSARSGGCDGGATEDGAAPMDTDAPQYCVPAAVVTTGTAVNGMHAMSRSASCAMEGDAVLRKGEAAAARTDAAAVAAAPADLEGTPKQQQQPVTDTAAAGMPLPCTAGFWNALHSPQSCPHSLHQGVPRLTTVIGAGAPNTSDVAPSLLHTLANAATADAFTEVPKASDTAQPLAASPPAMAPSNLPGRSSASAPQMNVADLFTQWPMPLAQATSMPDANRASTGGLPRTAQSLPEASLSHVLNAIPEGALGVAEPNAAGAVHAAPSGAFSSGAFGGLGGFSGLLPGKTMSLDPSGSGAFPKVEPLSRPGGPTLNAAAAVTTDELMNAFDEASELRLRALGAVGGALAAGRGGKRRRVDGGRTFHQSIGIGNVGKKGGSDTPGGVQVSMVALCNYILTHGGWEKVRTVTAPCCQFWYSLPV